MKTLTIGQYKIQDGMVAKINGGILTIREPKVKPITDLRCRDCKYFGSGHAFDNIYWTTTVCMKKPKVIPKKKHNIDIFYHVGQTTKPCDMFEPKELEL